MKLKNKLILLIFIIFLCVLIGIFNRVVNNNQYKDRQSINFIILGLDKRDDRLEKTEVTDSIIFASLNLKTAKLKTISIPRDLWDYGLKTKVNDIYPQAMATDNPFNFIQSSFGRITGQEIEKSIIITTNNLIDFVKVIGGVDVELEKGFKDEKYPNPDYIVDPQAPIYKTIEFPAGLNHLSEANITEFVRSRKSAETTAQGGTDIGRTERQQQLIQAIINKVKTKEFLGNPQNLINLYNFWRQNIQTNFEDKDLLNLALILGKNISNLSIQKYEIPIGLTAKDGIIYHPQKFINKQWVFIPSDKEYQGLQEFIKNSLFF